MDANEERRLHQLVENEGSDQLTTAVKRKKALEGLKASDGWAIIEAFIKEQVHLRTEMIMLNPVAAKDIEVQNFTRGEACFGKTLLNQIEVYLGEANDVIAMFNSATKEQTDVDPDDE